MVKLHLGCGEIILPGYVNCDLFNPKAEVKCDVRSLPFDTNSADEIYASHIIEHFHYYEAFDVLREWCRVLKPGAKIKLETPDMLESCRAFVNGNEQERIQLYGHIFAKPWLPGQTHFFLYTETQLAWTLEQCGFTQITRVPALRYLGKEHINLGMEAIKK